MVNMHDTNNCDTREVACAITVMADGKVLKSFLVIKGKLQMSVF
jgi:hypothetical protein